MIKIFQFKQIILSMVFITPIISFSEPIVMTGTMVPEILNKPISLIRIINSQGNALPFQIDEITKDGEYVCPQGERPNTSEGNGKLDLQDEIVFLWEDADSSVPLDFFNQNAAIKNRRFPILLYHKNERKVVYCTVDSSIPLSRNHYIDYDHQKQRIITPYFYAQFAPDRFSFIEAGIKDTNNHLVNLVKELRIEITLKALWGLLTIGYTEDNIICLVKRYKIGSVRLIRRGDFHLNLGLGVKGSRAIVNQLCYPQVVKAPVYIHLPFRFNTFFKEAWIEMTPVVQKVTDGFEFSIPEHKISFPFSSAKKLDTIIYVNPNKGFTTVDNGTEGYGWILQTDMADSLLSGSGYVYHKPTLRKGLIDCGYRLTVNNIPKGFYLITNWVVFSNRSKNDLLQGYHFLNNPAIIENSQKGKQQNMMLSGPHVSEYVLRK